MNKFAIYIHVPWCKRRCPYCDFYFVVGRPHASFDQAIIREWQERAYFNAPALSLYFGGGTPSMLAPSTIEAMVNFFSREALSSDAEITLEVNPEDVTQEYVASLVQTGVNRISLGIQSFNDKILKILGRKHSAYMAKNAIDIFLKNGLNNISIDFILGVDGQDPRDVLADLTYLNERNIPHISAYLLAIEDKTKFHDLIEQGKMAMPDEILQVKLYESVQSSLNEFGYLQYDISNYAKEGHFSRHNQVYWAFGDYLGLGPGAHSMRLLPDGSIERTHNQSDLSLWLLNAPKKTNLSVEKLDPLSALKEALAFGLRNMWTGINPKDLAKRHQAVIPDNFYRAIEKHLSFGHLDQQGENYKISKRGALFADSIMRDILGC
jgi:putative oxygen-independent coproporphyrinogen III oxidase